jgi:hypothetical protein
MVVDGWILTCWLQPGCVLGDIYPGDFGLAANAGHRSDDCYGNWTNQGGAL